jgi:hypothetical protein
MSLLGYPELKPAANQYESTGQHYSSANNGDGSVSLKCTKLNFIYLNSPVLINMYVTGFRFQRSNWFNYGQDKCTAPLVMS